MKITIVGGGNIGTQFAIHCSEKGHEVYMYTSKKERFSKHLEEIDEQGKLTHKGELACITDKDELAFSEADIILITYPAFMMDDIAKCIEPYVFNGMKIGLRPGTGGGECSFKKCIEKGVILFGIQRVPSVARLKEYGHSVCASGYRNVLHLASIPNTCALECAEFMESIFGITTQIHNTYLSITMTPSNPILHTTRLKTLFEDYYIGKIYSSIPLFYEEWNDETSELLFKCDAEVQEITHAIRKLDLSSVKSLREHYESDTPQKLTQKMRSIQSLKGLTTPSIAVDGGYIPHFESRYFKADFPYGLYILIQIAEFVGIEATNCQETLDWYLKFRGREKHFKYADYGIDTFEKFEKFYAQ